MPIEVVVPSVRRGPFRAVLFDFDGTLSLIREGWPRIMVGMMVQRLREQSLATEPEPQLWQHLDQMVMQLNGQPTIRQMEAFALELHRRGGKPAHPVDYLHDFTHRLTGHVQSRWDSLETARATPGEWVVGNAHAVLGNLQTRGTNLFLASGTDYESVSREARLLQVDHFFPTGINAPRGGDPEFRKAHIIARVLTELGIRGEELLGFGDGVVETQEVKRVGGVAVGVASSEPGSGRGQVDAAKRERLIAAGADVIVPDYARQAELVSWLWGE